MRKLFVVMVLALIMMMSRHARANGGTGMIEMQESADINLIAELLANDVSSEFVIDFGVLEPDFKPRAAALLHYTDDELKNEINTAVDTNHEIFEKTITSPANANFSSQKRKAVKKFIKDQVTENELASTDPEYIALKHEIDEVLAATPFSNLLRELNRLK